MTSGPEPRLLPCGDTALAVEFGSAIDPAIAARVLELDRGATKLDGVVETVPTYRSLLVRYDPTRTSFARLGEALRELAEAATGAPVAGRVWRIPVCYGGAFGIDLEATAALHDLSPEELIGRHAAPVYDVYMIGFLPGFAYLGGLDPSIATPRRTNPRLKTPPGTISIGGIQALVASIEAPSGWHLLGRTPVRNFMPGRDPAVLLQPGDRVRFERIDEGDFARLDREAQAGAPVAEVIA